ncbi:efflux RND transporter periplasmic adaptor subunit [Agrobacterium sp. P15N1-A]|uniref:efflux RND transporter periplasmic adaptor subunit n=1 Tax=Agrobacterium sp. P15N1-A TaxID=3342820 RepID=UPI0037CFB0D0
MMMTSRVTVRYLKIASMVAGALFAILSVFGAAERVPTHAVFTEPVVIGSIEETVLANGVLEPVRIVSVGAQVSGQLKTLHVKLGQVLKAGDLIAEVDSIPQANALRIAEASLANVKAQRKARGIQLNQAKLAYARQQMLRKEKAGSGADFETAEANSLALQAEVEALEAQIAQAAVEVESARANLGYTKVKAPMDGVVVAVVTKEGQTLNSMQAVPTIVVLAQLDIMRIKVQISEADIIRVSPGLNVRFTIMGDTRKPTPGLLESIEPAPTAIATESGAATATNSSATTAVYYNGLFETPNPDGRLRPMMTAVVTIITGRAEDVPLVAWAALTERDGRGRYRVQVRSASGGVSDRLVTIGLTDRLKAQVLDGLAVGDHVVIPADGQQSEDGSDMVMM